jgi:hypothetical protein
MHGYRSAHHPPFGHIIGPIREAQYCCIISDLGRFLQKNPVKSFSTAQNMGKTGFAGLTAQ